MSVKNLLVILVVSSTALSALGQGTVNFNNHTTGISAPIHGWEPGNPTVSKTGDTSIDTPAGAQTYNGSLLAGSGYLAQLFYAPGANQPESALFAVGSVTGFGSGVNSGFVVPVIDTLGVSSSNTVTIQIRAWDNTSNSYPDWSSAQTAWTAGTIAAGKSDLFNLLAGGGTMPPAPLSGLPVSFNIYFTLSPSPAITNQPASQTVPAGQNATFTAAVVGLGSLSYQWNFNGSPILGATNSAYTIVSAQVTNVGSYNLAVSNSFGAVTSSVALLTLAGTAVWTNALSDKWENVSNWIGGVVPSDTQSPFIVSAGSKTVTIDAATAGGFSDTMTVSNLTLANPATTSAMWTALASSGSPSGRANHTAVWTGTQMLVWGGEGAGNLALNDGGRYDAASTTWSAITTNSAVMARFEHTAVWTGTEMLIWGGTPGEPTALSSGGRYNPASDTWTAIATNGAPQSRYEHTAVWTGTEMIIWGGFNGGYLGDGARYNPASDTWTSMSTNGAPSARYLHTAVWTGTEMLVWGGNGGGLLKDGGRYNPLSDTWTPITTNAAPSARDLQTAVWTGTEMIIWGGYDGSSVLNSGGRYNPVANAWTATSAIGVPSARADDTAVWTGSDMFVWGGYNGALLSDGGLYNPAAGTWTALSISGAPSARRNHTAVWTGSDLIVWGGYNGSYLNDGGRYSGGATNVLDLTSGNTNSPLHVLNDVSLQQGGSLVIDDNSLFQVDGQTTIGDAGFPSATGIGLLTVNSGSATLANTVVGNTANSYGAIGLNGGTVQITSDLTLGAQFASTGLVSMTSGWLFGTNGTETIGSGGNGTFAQSGGTNQAMSVALGGSAGSQGGYTLSNATLNATTLTLGTSTGGLGTLTVQGNATVNIASNIALVSGSLSTTSSIALSGGSLIATNGLIQVGPMGRGQILITSGSHIVRQLWLGSTNGSGAGSLVMSGGSLRVLGTGTGPGAGVVVNSIVLPGGDFDCTGTSITIGGHSYDALAVLANSVTANCDALYVGASPGFTGTGTYVQSGGTMNVSTLMIVGDCASSQVGMVTVSNNAALYVTNDSHTAVLDMSDGSFLLTTGGTLVVDTLIVTNPCGQFVNNGGTLIMNNPPILGPSLSADGTGQSNTNALLAGTDPLDPSTAFRIISIVPTNATSLLQANLKDLRVDWTTVGGRSYVLQSASSPGTGSGFTDLSPVLVSPGTGYGVTNFVQLNALTGTAPRFYRVRTMVPVAADNASAPVYNDLDQWNTGDNGGFGFSPWTLNVSPPGGNGGFVVSDSAQNGSGSSGNINTEGNVAWGIYADNAVLCEAIRPLNAPLRVGQTLKLALDTGIVNSGGKVGLGLRYGSQDLLEFYALGGTTQYLIHDASGTAVATGVPFTDAGLLLEFTLTGANAYSLTITPNGGSPVTKTGTPLLNGFFLDTIRLYNSSAGALEANYFYFNCLLITDP